jgi:uncharacterized metal-binding protein YceD (DUF177 family)
MTQPEFSRAFRVDTLGEAPRSVSIEADASERAALARRFGLVAIDGLAAEAALSRSGETVRAEGRLSAQVTQSCVASGEPLEAAIDEPFALRFVPEDQDIGDEVELSEQDCDTLSYDGAAVDLGEAVAETLSLALDPFPRGQGAEAALKQAGVLSEGEAGPFAALKALKDKMGR